MRRPEGKVLGNTARLNDYSWKLNILHCFIIFVETNTTGRRIAFSKNWDSVWILNDKEHCDSTQKASKQSNYGRQLQLTGRKKNQRGYDH